jgi:hypothetical protein
MRQLGGETCARRECYIACYESITTSAYFRLLPVATCHNYRTRLSEYSLGATTWTRDQVYAEGLITSGRDFRNTNLFRALLARGVAGNPDS